MSFLERLNTLRYYRPFIEAVGGVKEVSRATDWSLWYAVKWWEEVFHELGLEAVRRNPFARALYISLRLRGHVREDGHVARRPARPEYPTNRYAIEFVELHEAFDRLGAANVASNNVDENTLQMLHSTMLSQGWYRVLRRTFLELMEVSKYSYIIEPLVREGHNALAVFELHSPKVYMGYDYRSDSLELASSVLKARRDGCGDGNVCLYYALTACDFVKLARAALPQGADAVLLLQNIYWMMDPARELRCLRDLLRPGARLLVGQQVVESTPGLLAMDVAFGAKHVLGWTGVERLLTSAGYGLVKRYLTRVPYYVAVWSREPRLSYSSSI